ncbi:antigen [Methanosarcina barkeri str. Wiesmoor]|uniref:Antigen n=2 Tax=Methanosarcina barkeri TaxID=2208 RepID=A0A0E3QPK7_METBA|nr:PRC-barrel domain-containing protein [Methanosarcina barkeri]AKB52444.1 antigen [Methanosarcina barkeri str. Wiesmoor]
MADRDDPDFLSLGTIKGGEVANRAGEGLGKIEELMIDLQSGRIAYAVLSFREFIGLGDKFFAIPWQSLSLRLHDHAFLLGITKETLEKTGSLEKGNWPLTREELAGTYASYGYQPYWQADITGQPGMTEEAESERMSRMETMAGRANPDFLSAGTIKGDKVVNKAGEHLGKIEELMIDLEDGRVAYAALSFGGFLGLGSKLFAIPWQALQMKLHDHVILLDIPKDVLEKAEGFDKEHWPVTNREWLSAMYSYYGYQPYWQAQRIENRPGNL